MRKAHASSDAPLEPVWVTVDSTCRLSGLGRSTVYELIQAGVLKSTKVGGRRLVSVTSIHALGEQAA